MKTRTRIGTLSTLLLLGSTGIASAALPPGISGSWYNPQQSGHGLSIDMLSRDRALVWRTTGGKHRWLTGDCDQLVEDSVAAFRQAAIAALGAHQPVTLESLQAEHELLMARMKLLQQSLRAESSGPADDDAVMLWSSLGIAAAAQVPDLEVHAVREMRPALEVV